MKSFLSSMLRYAFVPLAAIFLFMSCEDDSTEVEEDNPIAQIKSDDWRASIGDEVTIDAMLSLSPEPMLLFDFEDRNQNRAIPEARYIRLNDPTGLLSALGNQFHGARVSVRATIEEDVSTTVDAMTTLLGATYPCILDLLELPTMTGPSSYAFPEHNDPCEATPALCDLSINWDRETYALIYSGGINSEKAYMRYWNDMVFFSFHPDLDIRY